MQSLYKAFFIFAICLISHVMSGETQRDVYPRPIWSCSSLENSFPKKYELKIYRRKGDQRFQFVFMQIKPKRIMMADIAEAMEKVPKGEAPVKSIISKMLFSFSIDKAKKIKNGFLGLLELDQSYDLKNPFKFPVEDPLRFKCSLVE